MYFITIIFNDYKYYVNIYRIIIWPECDRYLFKLRIVIKLRKQFLILMMENDTDLDGTRDVLDLNSQYHFIY